MRKLIIGLILAGLMMLATAAPALAAHHFSACGAGNSNSNGAVVTAFNTAPGVGTPGSCAP